MEESLPVGKAHVGPSPGKALRARTERASAVLSLLSTDYPDARCALEFSSPEELLVATILSAQCTDSMVNRVTPVLFRRFPVPYALADAPLVEVQSIIKQCGYYRQKARFIRDSCRMIVREKNGRVPKSLEELTQLPGVARKTANVVLSVAFGINEGVAVDTHVARLSRRLGLTRNTDPGKIERDLMKIVGRVEWGMLTTLLIAHGRAVCHARKAECGRCSLSSICPSAFKVRPRGANKAD